MIVCKGGGKGAHEKGEKQSFQKKIVSDDP